MAEIYLLYINYHDIGMTSDSLYAVYEDKELAEQNKATLEKSYPGADVFIDVQDIVRSEKANDDTRHIFEMFYDEWKEKWLLRKALWIARKERAKSEKCYWMHIHQKHGSPAGVYFRINHRESSKYGAMRKTPREWYNAWMRVEYRCDKKLTNRRSQAHTL